MIPGDQSRGGTAARGGSQEGAGRTVGKIMEKVAENSWGSEETQANYTQDIEYTDLSQTQGWPILPRVPDLPAQQSTETMEWSRKGDPQGSGSAGGLPAKARAEAPGTRAPGGSTCLPGPSSEGPLAAIYHPQRKEPEFWQRDCG